MTKNEKIIIIAFVVILLGAGLHDMVYQGVPDTPFDVLVELVLGITGFVFGPTLYRIIKNNVK